MDWVTLCHLPYQQDTRWSFDLKKCITILSVLVIVSCDLPFDPGPMPSHIEETEFETGLNIFGILRVDGRNYGTSFVRVERAYQLHEIEIDQAFVPTINNARVQIIHQQQDTTLFPLKYDGTYDNENFIPKSGKSYRIQIDSTDFPVLKGSTVIPTPPIIVEDRSLSTGLGLNITPDSSIHLIEIYPVYDMGIDFSKRITNNHETIQFSVPTQHEKYGPLNRIEVFSYDKNMSDYLQALVTVKPQAYNEMVKTVDGGYGVFGSVVKSEIFK